MNALHIPNALVETLGWVLFHSVWELALIAVAAWLVTRAMRSCSAKTRYGMLVFALVAMSTAPVATLLVLPKPEPMVEVPHYITWTAPVGATSATTWAAPGVASDASAPEQLPAATESTDVRGSIVSFWSGVELAVHAWLHWIVGLWCLGVCLFAWRPALSLREVGRLRREGVSPAVDTAAATLRDLARRMRISRAVQILESTRVQVPVVVGYLRPMILLPVSLASQLPVPQLEAILAHELAHVRRHDYLVNLWQILVETLLFHHPAVWWLSYRIRVERENCCDDIAVSIVENRVEYGLALLAVAELRGPQTTLALGARSGSLLTRVGRLFPSHSGRRTFDSGNLVALVLLASSILAVAVWATAAAKEPDATAETKDQPPAAERVLRFPAERTMGIVFVRESNEMGYAHVAPKEWKKVGDARGEVRVPAGKEIRLDLSKAASRDLSGLDQLQADDLAMLNCLGTDVTDEGLAHVGRLSGLLILNLDETRITDEGMRHLSALTKLRSVNLEAFGVNRQGFGVGDESLKILARFPDLEAIRLRDTKVTGAGLAALAPLKSLKILNLSGTKIGDAGLAHLEQLPALETLHLGVSNDGAEITDEGLKTVGKLVNLKYLTLSGNKITGAGLDDLKNLSRLEDLALDDTGLTEAALAHLEPLRSLQKLRLYTGHRVTDVGAAHLAKLKSLRQLTENLTVTDAGIESLASLPHLERLSLLQSKITIEGVKKIAGMKSLQWLFFYECPIGDEELAVMCDLPNLEFLTLAETQVSGDGLAQLARLPKLSILSLDFGARDEQPAGPRPDLREVAKLPHLKDLRLRGWGLDSNDLESIAAMPGLEELNVGFPVDDQGAQQIASLRNLTSLEISNGVLTDVGVKHLSNLRKLTFLDLTGHFSDRGLESLAQLKLLWGFQVRSPYITTAGLRALERQLPALQYCDAVNDADGRADAEVPATVEFYIGESEPREGLTPAIVGGKHLLEDKLAKDPEIVELTKKITEMQSLIKQQGMLLANPNHFSLKIPRRQLSQLEEQIEERQAEIRRRMVEDGELVYLHQKPVLTRDDIREVNAVSDKNNGPAIGITFTDAGAAKIGIATAESIGKRIAVVVDGKVIFAAKIRTPIKDRAEITLRFSKTEVERLVQAISGSRQNSPVETEESAAASATRPYSSERDRLKAIGLALQVYYGANKHFPGLDARDNFDRPLLSWRVAILPYIDNGLYKQFHLDEPWDSDHNRTLIDKMPDEFRSARAGLGRTRFLAAVDPQRATAPPARRWSPSGPTRRARA